MKNDRSPIEYGKLACDALMHRFAPEKLPPETVLFYHQGVFLSGMQNIWRLCKEQKYFDYIKAYIDSVIGPNGEVYGICHEMTPADAHGLTVSALTKLDNKQPVILLYDLYDETGDEKYLHAIHTISQSMYYWPVNRYGGYWHMMTQPDQMWMDGAYMAGPLSVLYSKRFGDPTLRNRAIHQILLMDRFLRDEKTGLYFHGWDASGREAWADPNTGLSQEIWGRAVGWYAVAILDVLEHTPREHPEYDTMVRIELELLRSLVKYQDPKTGMWFEVLDKPDRSDNWVESSCTNLFIYSYAKAICMGLAKEAEFATVLEKAYAGMVDALYTDDEGYLVIDHVCVGTCIDAGTYEHYISRARIKNDLHGAGAFILMCAQMERYRRRR